MTGYTVMHLFGPPNEAGGGIGVMMRPKARTMAKAIEMGEIRLTQNADPEPDDRIQILRRGEHPTWLYRDGDGRVCMWRRRPSEPLEIWGFTG